MPAGLPASVAVTASPTVPVSTTDAIGNAILGVFQNANVQQAIGGGIGDAINAALGAAGLPGVGGETAEQKAARLEAERKAKAAEFRNTMIIVGGVAVVLTIVVVMIVRRS